MASWIDVPHTSPFTEATLPYGIVSRDGDAPRAAVAIGDHAIDLAALGRAGLFDRVVNDPMSLFASPVLDRFAGAGREVWSAVRRRIQQLLERDNHELQGQPVVLSTAILPRPSLTMHRPIGVGDYVDFFSSIEHATNLGKILRPDSEPLLQNYRSLPVGYHGRSSTVVVSGTPVVRPCGQSKPAAANAPEFGPSKALDFELELAFVTGPGNALGMPIPIERAGEHIFGCVILCDWSARDLQAWEYQPLGPFLAKSFATSISPWIVPLEALEPFRIPTRVQEPEPLPYLRTREDWGFAIDLRVTLESAKMREEHVEPATISQTSFADMYWSMAQQLAHVTSNGAQIRPGDLYGSGTISGTQRERRGSMIEITWRGAEPLDLPGGERRAFLEDGDCITMSARCASGNVRVGFGEVSGTILPAGSA